MLRQNGHFDCDVYHKRLLLSNLTLGSENGIILSVEATSQYKTKDERKRLMTKTVIVEKVVETTISSSTAIVALDTTNAKDLLAKLDANKSARKALEANYDSLQSEIYALLGYIKVSNKWVGSAEQGTIGGIPVVTVSTVNAEKFNKNALLADKPELLPIIEAYTEPNPYKVLKTVR